MKCVINALILITLCVPGISAADSSQQLPAIGRWAGPFDGTVITKYADYSEGVACYVYHPESISTSVTYSSGNEHTNFNGSIGTISCVKVANPPSSSKKQK